MFGMASIYTAKYTKYHPFSLPLYPTSPSFLALILPILEPDCGIQPDGPGSEPCVMIDNGARQTPIA